MKRSMEDVLGRPMSDDYRQDVAGAPRVTRNFEVASFWHALDDPMGTAEADAELAAEFAEFMDGGRTSDASDASDASDRGAFREPDPMFRERLRRRLWRAHVIANLRESGETH